MDDWNQLQQFVRDGSNSAMDELIRRYLDMVYATALREVHDTHLAEDVAQAVFLVLMRRAGTIGPQVVLPGWLFKVTRFAAADVRKGRSRRRHFEREAAAMKSESIPSENTVEMRELLPLLNAAIAVLPTAGRDAVIMCYLQGKSHREIADAQRITENAARQRLFRAIESIRSYFHRKGIAVTGGAISSALSVASAQAAPASLAARMNSSVLSASGGNAALIAKATLSTIMITQFKIAAMILLMMILLATAAGGIVIYDTATPTPAPAPINNSAGPAPATRPVGPKEALLMGYQAACDGDEEKFIACFTPLSPAEEISARKIVRAIAAAHRLDNAVTAMLHQDANWEIFRSLGIAVTPDDLRTATEQINGDAALIILAHASPAVIPLVKVGDSWKAPAIVIDGFNMVEIDGTASNAKAFQKLASDILAGKYHTYDTARNAIMQISQVWYFKPTWSDSGKPTSRP